MELSDYVLGIHSNVHKIAEFSDGHAWITITHKKQLLPRSYGLWPDNHPLTTDNGNKTDVRIGMEPHRGINNRYYALTKIQYAKLFKLINTTAHWFYTNNCASWASSIVYQVFRTEIDADDWLGFETPRELSRNIEILERYDPTSIDAPKIISWVLTRRGLRREK